LKFKRRLPCLHLADEADCFTTFISSLMLFNPFKETSSLSVIILIYNHSESISIYTSVWYMLPRFRISWLDILHLVFSPCLKYLSSLVPKSLFLVSSFISSFFYFPVSSDSFIFSCLSSCSFLLSFQSLMTCFFFQFFIQERFRNEQKLRSDEKAAE